MAKLKLRKKISKKLRLPDFVEMQDNGSSIELGASRRDQRRRSSALSAASSIARHYRPLDDEMEVAQDEL